MRSLRRVFWDAVSDVGVLSAWALYLVARVAVFLGVCVFVARMALPFCMIALAENIGMSADTPLLDLVFIYGASGLFVVGMALVVSVGVVRGANRVLIKIRDAALRLVSRPVENRLEG